LSSLSIKPVSQMAICALGTSGQPWEVGWDASGACLLDVRESFKCDFGEKAVLAPAHGHVPIYRPRLPGALCRGSQAELSALKPTGPSPPSRSLWPHLEELVRMTEVPIGLPGATSRLARTLRTEAELEQQAERAAKAEPQAEPRQVMEERHQLPSFDAEAALRALREERLERERRCRFLDFPRGRPLGLLGPGLGACEGRASLSEDMRNGARAERREEDRGRQGQGAQGRRSSRSRSPGNPSSMQGPEAPSLFARAEARILASLRPGSLAREPACSFVMRPPVVEWESPSRPERERTAHRRPSARSRRSSATDLRAREKLGKLLVAHYEVRFRKAQVKTAKLMRVVLGIEEEKPESILEGLTVLQNAQKLLGVVDESEPSSSRVVLRVLSILDRRAGARSSLADSARALEELTSNEEKLLVDMVDLTQAPSPAEPEYEEEAEIAIASLLGPPNKLSSGAVKQAWEVVHREASEGWVPKAREKGAPEDAKAMAKKKSTRKEESAAEEQARHAHAMAVYRFAKAEASNGALSDSLGEDSLRRAARIEYAIKAASAASVDPNHPELSKAWQLAYDLRAHRAFRYCLNLMKSIEPVLGSAGQVANEIDQVVQEASEVYGVPKDHKWMEEARRLVLQARSEEAKVKRKEDAARRKRM